MIAKLKKRLLRAWQTLRKNYMIEVKSGIFIVCVKTTPALALFMLKTIRAKRQPVKRHLTLVKDPLEDNPFNWG
jgi:hypothetical protein